VKRVVILGSTGSIGVQALDVIRSNPERFEVVGLGAGRNRTLLDEQAAAFGVEHTAIGAEEASELVRDVDADVVLNGITGSVGLGPSVAALAARSCPSTPSIPRSRRRCAPARLPRSRGSC
jgi:1-deoxy-D-xylulose-5-phosphate reductoisomerase